MKILLGFLRYKNDGESLQKFIIENEKLMNAVTSLTEETIAGMCNIEVESLYKEILDIQNEEEIRREIEEKYRKEGELHMNEAFKQIFVKAQDESRKAGYDEGRNTGRNENKREIISNMKKEGLTIDKIAIYTGLSVSEVNSYMR